VRKSCNSWLLNSCVRYALPVAACDALIMAPYSDYTYEYNQTVNDGVAHSKNPTKVRVSRDLWPWLWPWAHPGCTLTWSPSCESLVAIRPFVCEKRFAQKFTDRRTDGRTDNGRHVIALAHSWNELKISIPRLVERSVRKSLTASCYSFCAHPFRVYNTFIGLYVFSKTISNILQ